MAAPNHHGARGGRLGESEANRSFEPSAREALCDGGRQCREMGAKCGRPSRIAHLFRLERRIEAAHCPLDETSHLVRAAEQIAPALPFGRHLLGLERILGEARARAALALLRIAPLRLHRRGGWCEVEIERELAAAA